MEYRESEFNLDKFENISFEKEDKNHTKYYKITHTCCPRCGGNGKLYEYRHIDEGVCYKCLGSGYFEQSETIKVLTDVYFDKLTQKRNEKLLEKAKKVNKTFLINHGFDEDGNGFAIVGSNTLKIKDTLKEIGCKWTPSINCWVSPKEHSIDNVEFVPVSASDIYDINKFGEYLQWATSSKLSLTKKTIDTILTALKEKELKEIHSEYVGEIGKRMEFKLILQKTNYYESYFGVTTYYTFNDNDGNIFIWKASGCPLSEIALGTLINIKGTIKEHKEYNGIKETIINRCSLM